ncbi:hypothetical protein E4U43_007045 [Claviceps pusilla]|uniref:Aminotransferase class I/classII large domain-containing protein n=1 Tax=Claviceps pusilla TaxID=123648 RepID=A0A9P7ND49_9HYPO|nr:hypothetical protein E4U43_007045 [Claviceps pusilla]
MAYHPFEHVPAGQLESLIALQDEYAKDTDTRKISLMAGVYRTGMGHPFVLPAVKAARKRLVDDPLWNHEYPASHLGSQRFRRLSEALFFGEDSVSVQGGRLASMQCLGASGACHMGAVFVSRHYAPFRNGERGKIYIPEQTWVNHSNVFRHVGLETHLLPWYSPSLASLDMDALIKAIDTLPARSVIVLQTAGNNPTGCDPSLSQWRALAEVFARREHLAFLDAAYPGFVTGDVELDCEPIRIFAAANIPIVLAATFGKSFGLYGERVGILTVTLPSKEATRKVEDHMKLLARAETGAQPAFGAAIVEMILSDPELRRSWQDSVCNMAAELQQRRSLLKAELVALGTPGRWDNVTKQVGMFL